MANEIIGAKSYAYLIGESTWGTTPGSPQRVFLPVEQYDVQFRTQQRQAKPFLGRFQRAHAQRRQGMPSGSLSAALYGQQFGVDENVGGTTVAPGSSISLAEYLLDWALCDEAGTIHEADELPSKSIEWAEGPDVANVTHKGMRANSATLSGSDSTGPIMLALDLMGKSEAALATATAPPDDLETLTEMEFADTVFQIDDGAGGSLAALPIQSFQMQCQHALVTRYNNADNPTLLLKTDRMVGFTITIDKNTDDFDAIRRDLTQETDYVSQLLLQGTNNGTGGDAWTKCTMDFPRLRYLDHQDARNREGIFQTTINFLALKPDTTADEMAIAWTEGASKT